MTFTEAAVEVLRRAGKPLHFKDIASEAINAGLLSHVGQTPEATMGSRLLAMARREHDRRVVATDTGVFALVEWNLPVASQVDSSLGEPQPGQDETPYRTRERHPPLQEEYSVGGRREERRRSRAESDTEGGQRRKRYGPPSEAAHQWLRQRGSAATLAEIASALRATDAIAEALERDISSFEKALREENRRRADSGRALMFEFQDDGSVLALDVTKEAPREKREPAPARAEKPRKEEPPKLAALDEQRRTVLRTLRRRIASLDVGALERVSVALLEAMGFRELNMARRNKEGPLYLARHRWGAGELRYAVRVLRPGRDIGRSEVQELRKDVSHFSAQIGIVFGAAECSREAKAEANVPGATPVMLYGNEALAETLIETGLGVSRRMIEWLEYDESFFVSVGAGDELPMVDAEPVAEAPAAAAAAAPEARPSREERRRNRERRRERRRDAEPATPAPAEASEPAPAPEAQPAAEAETQPSVADEASREPEAVHLPADEASRAPETVHLHADEASRAPETVHSHADEASRAPDTDHSHADEASRAPDTVHPQEVEPAAPPAATGDELEPLEEPPATQAELDEARPVTEASESPAAEPVQAESEPESEEATPRGATDNG